MNAALQTSVDGFIEGRNGELEMERRGHRRNTLNRRVLENGGIESRAPIPSRATTKGIFIVRSREGYAPIREIFTYTLV
jgi:hypothetical protein